MSKISQNFFDIILTLCKIPLSERMELQLVQKTLKLSFVFNKKNTCRRNMCKGIIYFKEKYKRKKLQCHSLRNGVLFNENSRFRNKMYIKLNNAKF